VYSKGAITEASPRRKASVIAHWPTAPDAAIPARVAQCSGRIGCHTGRAKAPAPRAVSAISQNTIVWVESVRPSTRTEMAESA
jgi:hypothetical protein